MKIIGLMSGTSLDGLDIAYCDINDGHFQLIAAETYPYDEQWVKWLSTLETATAYEYALIDVELGHYFGKMVNRFRHDHPGPVDAIASHGHTIFHQPHLGLTTQIGDGDAIAAETELPVVFRFRNLDVALGGQGAPLVPIGDRLLFGQYDVCLNLGGIANISYEGYNQLREAYDICPCNMALNYLARLVGKPYDKNGLMARNGKTNADLLAQMDNLDYYRQPLPKSLGKEWFVSEFQPLLDTKGLILRDLLCTTVEHIARQIASAVKGRGLESMLVTGGGSKNKYLIARIQALVPNCRITVPNADIIDYKEAIIFALLGYLRLSNKANCLSSVTGARIDNCGGCIAGLVPRQH
ncbi:MAG: anhydro-N-acetylmuramic acid kinase [Bacteroidales bacterium]|nr:anhydro-N-acetylmuramic acid kinase [Bacteroidales bacterium]